MITNPKAQRKQGETLVQETQWLWESSLYMANGKRDPPGWGLPRTRIQGEGCCQGFGRKQQELTERGKTQLEKV